MAKVPLTGGRAPASLELVDPALAPYFLLATAAAFVVSFVAMR